MNVYVLGTALNMASILMIAACGSFLSIKGGNFNLGGEGQVYAGGFAGAIFLYLFKSFPVFFAVPVCLILSGLIALALAFIPALMKQYRKVDVLLSSFLISAGIIPIIDSLISGRFRGQTNNLLATEFIPENFRFPSILKPSSLNLSFFAAIILCVLLYILMTRSGFGHKLSVFGISPDFSTYSGFSSRNLTLLSVSASGFFHGVAGFVCIAGTYYTCHSGFYSGFGWNALSVALISIGNPLLIIPFSILIAFAVTGASQFSLMNNFGFDMGSLLQGMILFVIVLFSGCFLKVKK